MFQTFAYEIGAVFFVVALLIGSTFLRGFSSQEMVRTFKLAALGLILAGAGVWVYHALPGDPAPVTETKAVPDPRKQTQKSKHAEALRESDRKALAAAMAEEAAKPDVPTHIDVRGPETSPEKPRKGIIMSVGRALHVIPKTQQ